MAGAGGGAGNLKPLVMTGMPFVIVRQHARGGLGVVSLARDDQIRREVALKQILPQHVDNPVLKRRFVYEGQITGQLEHPSIVPVYTMGADEAGNPFYVMRFVKGRTLDEIIKEHHASPNPIVFRELLRRFIAVCQAVAYAHSRGVIHRDLKPANVMLGDYGETLVLDWGLAKDIRPGAVDPAAWGTGGKSESGQASMAGAGATLNGRTGSMVQGGGGGGGSPASELTMEGQIIGTPAYMAPEQAEGRTELHGPVTDIYALGGILYKILCGHSPQAPTASTDTPGGSRRLTYVPSPAPSTVSGDVPETLEQICVRAMARDPGGRYARALELAQDVQRWLDEHPLTLRPRTGLGRLQGWMRAHVGLMLAAMAGMAVTIAVLGAALLLHGPRK
jgi:serine/threonine protein kinase